MGISQNLKYLCLILDQYVLTLDFRAPHTHPVFYLQPEPPTSPTFLMPVISLLSDNANISCQILFLLSFPDPYSFSAHFTALNQVLDPLQDPAGFYMNVKFIMDKIITKG